MAAGVVLVLSLLCLCGVRTEEEASDGYKAPHFCRESECPRFQLVKKYEKFELREYEGSRWVTTPLEFDFLGIGLYKSFNRLYNYLNGENLEGIKIELTLPVRIYIPLINPTDKNATMSLFVPPSVVEAPQPLYEEVYLESIPPQSIYVKSFGGYALKSDYDNNAKLLSEELEALGLPFERTYGVAAGYSDLLTFFDRHNEAWYIAL